MNYNIFSQSVIGYKNILKKNVSQDYLKYCIIDEATICAVSDGHSSDFFKYSDKGAKIACEVVLEVLKEISKLNYSKVKDLLQKEVIQKKIYNRWMELVYLDYTKGNPLVFKTEYLRYSTTLVAVIVASNFRLFFKIGDGNIIVNKEGNFREFLKTRKCDVIDSLGRADAYKNIMYFIEDINISQKDNIIIFTDGYEQSFETKSELYKSINDTLQLYNKNVFTRETLKRTYKLQLKKLSKQKSKDDISIIFMI